MTPRSGASGPPLLPSVQVLRAEIESAFSDLLEPEFPRFSGGEMARRRELAADLCRTYDLDTVLVVGAMRAGTATFWLTGWPVTQEAVTLVIPGRTQCMFVQHFNHTPQAKRLAVETDVSWGEESGVRKALSALRAEFPDPPRLGVIGSLQPRQFEMVRENARHVTDLNRAYSALRQIKSAEELRWFQLGAALTDLGVAALAEGARTGMNERELGAVVEAAYQPLGAVNAIHYFLVTPMSDPQVAVPAQFPSTRKLQRGDVLVCEISAQFWEHSGQVLRTFTVGEPPNPLYRRLHDVAEAAYQAVVSQLRPGAVPADLIAASSGIEAAGYTVVDDLVHGYGGGYLPPVLGTVSRPAAGPVPDRPLAAGMMVVVQPNVGTPDGRAGVQTGNVLLITEDGAEPMQHFPPGLHVLPG